MTARDPGCSDLWGGRLDATAQGSASAHDRGAVGRTLLVLRHGITEHNARGIWQGQLDTPLAPAGVEQARVAGAGLAAFSPAVLVSSDLARARSTGAQVGAQVGIAVRLDGRLREIHCGRWQGLSRVEVEQRYPAENAAVLAGHDVPRGGDGETVAAVVARARPAVDDLVAGLAPGGCGVVVTHGVTARGVVGDLLGLDPVLAWRVLGPLGNCAWAHLEQTRGGWRLLGWNVTGHGRPSSLVGGHPDHTGHPGHPAHPGHDASASGRSPTKRSRRPVVKAAALPPSLIWD